MASQIDLKTPFVNGLCFLCMCIYIYVERERERETELGGLQRAALRPHLQVNQRAVSHVRAYLEGAVRGYMYGIRIHV